MLSVNANIITQQSLQDHHHTGTGESHKSEVQSIESSKEMELQEFNDADEKTTTGMETLSSDDVYEDEDAKLPPPKNFRELVHRTFENPGSSKVALSISLFIMGVIVLSTITFILGSLPQYWENSSSALQGLEIFAISVFTAEYVIRLVSAPVWYKWMIVPFNIVDILAILPFYIELGLASNTGALAVIRVVRLLRIFRVFKVGKYSGKLQVLVKTFMVSVDGLTLMAFLVGLALILFSTMLFYAEQVGQSFDSETQTWLREDGSESPFQSIPATFWWCIVTITTVGYGDTFPVTWLGKIVAGITMLCGILVLAFPISLLGTNFTDQWKAAKKDAEKRHAIRRMKKKGLLRQKPVQEILSKMAEIHEELGERITTLRSEIAVAKEQYNELSQLIVLLGDNPTIAKIIEESKAKNKSKE